MSREIKFRAWDDVLLKYLPSMTIEQIGRANMSGTNWYQLTIEQFTGLHDKNGVEIYENDVVSDGKYHGIVEFWDCSFVVNWEISCPHDNDLNYWNDKIEVIGNIHESEETSCN